MCDQDDVWFKNKIEEHMKIFEKEPTIVIIVNNAIRTDSKLNPGISQIEYMRLTCNGNTKVGVGCYFSIRKNFLNLILPLPEFSSHDNVINGCTAPFNIRKDINEPLQFFRRFPESLSSKVEHSDCITTFQCYLTRLLRIIDFFTTKTKVINDLKRYYELAMHLEIKLPQIKQYLESIKIPKNYIKNGIKLTEQKATLFKKRYSFLSINNKGKRFFSILIFFIKEHNYTITLMIKDILIMLYN